MDKRLLIAGLGSIGLRHARLCENLPNLTVEVCDSRTAGLDEARRQSPKVVCWEDYASALDSWPDYVLVATPHHLHASMAMAALERGIPVLCEKPMSHDLGEAAEMASLSARNGVSLAVGYHLRFHPSILRLGEMLKRGQLGAALYARYCVDSLVTLENSRSRYQATLPGSLLMDYSHGLDLLINLFQASPNSVMARGLDGSIAHFEAKPLLLSAILGYERAFQAELHLSYAVKPELHTLEVTGTQASISLALNGGEISLRQVEDGSEQATDLPYVRDQLYLAQWAAFVDFCEGRPSLICSAEQALRVNELMDQLLAAFTAR